MQNYSKNHLIAIFTVILCLIIAIPLLLNQPSTPPASAASEESPAIEAEEAPVQDATAPFVIEGDLDAFQPQDPLQPVYDAYTIQYRQTQGFSTQLVKIEPYYHPNTVYLTFDDGPNDKNTVAVLDILKQENVKATFFLLGNQLRDYPEVVKRIYNEHHALGNHSYSHDYQKLYASTDAYIDEMQKTDSAFQEIIGVRPLITRAPGGVVGHFTDDYWQELDRFGYLEVGWNITAGDSSDGVAEDLIGNIVHQLDTVPELNDHAIILMHSSAGHEETVKALPEIIHILKSRGFSFGVITPSTPPAW